MNTSWSGMKQHMVKNGMKYSDGQDWNSPWSEKTNHVTRQNETPRDQDQRNITRSGLLFERCESLFLIDIECFRYESTWSLARFLARQFVIGIWLALIDKKNYQLRQGK
jgi:hypothetical protein